MIVVVYFVLFKLFFHKDIQFLNELQLHLIDQNELRSIVKDEKNSHFIAFYEEKDLNARNIELLNSVIQVQQNYQEQISFYWYNSKIPKDFEIQYYLHYYTLPKLKFFQNGQHLTYKSGRSLKSVQNWVNQKFMITKSSSKVLNDVQDFKNKLKENKRIVLYIGNLRGHNFKSFLESISKLKTNNIYHTESQQIQQQFVNLNFSNGHIFTIEYGLAGSFNYNRYMQKNINSKQLNKFYSQNINRKIPFLTKELFVDIAKNKENYYIYFGKKQKFKVYNIFCQKYSKNACTQITDKLDFNSQLFRNYFPVDTSQVKILYVKGQINYERYPVYQLQDFQTIEDLKKFQHDIQENKLNEVVFSEEKTVQNKLIYYFAHKDFYDKIKKLQSDVLVMFHNNDCGQICEDYIKEAEKISQVYIKKYGQRFVFRFGLYNMFKNTTPFEITKQITFYLFPKSNPKNHIKAFVARDMSSLKNFIFKNSPALNEVEFDEL